MACDCVGYGWLTRDSARRSKPALIAKEISFTLDPLKKPKATDDILPDGKMIHGIYQLDGDMLKSCVAAAGKERPAEFAAGAGTGHTLRVFKRVKK